MTVATVIKLMGQMRQLHESLVKVSKQKTEVLKANDTNELQQLLVSERKHIQAINKIEKQRAEAVGQWYNNRGIQTSEPTVSDMLSYLQGEEHQALKEAYNELILVLADLKNQERLNAELTKQSLQFVNLSLDMLQPSLDSVNYGGKQDQTSKPKRSVFDSKA